ncbi:MAG: glycosyltransferase family 4 protein [Gemmatimonadales bacterium]
MMDDIRWFAPNRFCGLILEPLRQRGFTIADEGDRPAKLAVVMDGQSAVEGMQYARRHRCPLVLYVWDLPPWRLGGGRSDFIFAAGKRIFRIPRPVGGYPERSGFYSRLRWVARRAVAVWAPSTLTAEDLLARFSVKAEVVPFCYDSTRFQPLVRSSRPGVRLLSISRLVRHKNHIAVIFAAAQMEPRPTVHLIGQGPERETLRYTAAQLGVELRIDSEWQSDEAIAAAYRAASVVVAPSRFEGFGLTPMEAVAQGIPTVASDIAPHRQHLRDAVTYFDPEHDAMLVRAIETASYRPPGDPDTLAHLTIAAATERFERRLRIMLDRLGQR